MRLKPPSLGETVALIGVIIAGLGLYLSNVGHQKDRQAADRAAAQAQRVQAQARAVLVLRGEGEGARIRLAPANPDQVVQSQTFYFPTPVKSDSVQTTGEGRIDAGWFAAGLKRALHGADDNGAEHGLPVGISTTYVEDGETHTDQSIYRLGFTVHPRLLQGAEVRIEGVALGRRGAGGGLRGAVDAAWAREAPAKPDADQPAALKSASSPSDSPAS